MLIAHIIIKKYNKDESLSYYTIIRQEFEKLSYDNQPEFRVNFQYYTLQCVAICS